MEQAYLINILLVIGAYLLGSISNAVWIGKTFYGIDPRTQGSKNAGATNAVRVLGAKAGGAVFLLDALKGSYARTPEQLPPRYSRLLQFADGVGTDSRARPHVAHLCRV